MHWNMILSILRKDILDATRDARVLMALIIPIGIGVFYSVTSPDEVSEPSATVAYTAAEATGLPDALQEATGDAVELTFVEFESAAQVREQVADEEAGIGLVVPAGFDRAVEQGESPELDVILPDDPGLSSQFVLSSLTPTLRQMAGQGPPATIQVDALSPGEENVAVFEALGIRSYFILAALLMFVAFVALLAMPVTLTEEVEKKTLEALVLVASYADVIIAKALLGFLYVLVGVPIMLWLTDQVPEQPVVFAGAVALIGIALIGFGLFIGVLFRNANQLNTWAGIILIPVVAPAFMVGVPLPEPVDAVLLALPVSQAMRLLVNALGGEPFFANVWLSWLVIAGWAVVGYALLTWRLTSQEA